MIRIESPLVLLDQKTAITTLFPYVEQGAGNLNENNTPVLMPMKNLYFLHGMESSPKGTKAQLLKQHYPQCIIPELTPNIAERNEVLDQLITEPAWLVGSSLGGLSALFFTMKKPELVKAMILLAPAVGFFDPNFFDETELKLIEKTYIPTGIPTTIIAGKQDDVIPMSAIESLIDRSPANQAIEFIRIDDDHSLNRYPRILLNCIERMPS